MLPSHISKLIEDPTNFTPPTTDKQMHKFNGKIWYVDSLIESSKVLPQFRKPLSEFRAVALESAFPGIDKMTHVEFAYHCRLCMDADLSYPILLGQDGRIMDGRHRFIKSLI